MSVQTGRLLGQYRLLEKIGEGGMSEVWRALDTRLDREVAVKFLPETFPTERSRLVAFESEAKAIAALSHPNIVTIYSIEEVEGRHFITMELVKGSTLEGMIPPGGFPFKAFYDIAIPMVEAVSAAHQRGVTHRDLKPRNVMVSEEGTLKILDFGLAIVQERPRSTIPLDATTRTLTVEGQIAGTMPYMSPEQLEGKPLGPPSDLFSLGVMLYRMATGRLPFQGASGAQIIAAILKDEPRSPDEINPEIPRHLARVIRECLEKDPERRIPSARDLLRELEALRRARGSPRTKARRSIAVLPFADMSPEKDQDYFCEGIAEEIINALTKIQDLRVASRTSAFQFKSRSLDSREIGDRLGVGTLLEGSVRKDGTRLRITAQLVNALDGYHLWSERYDREFKDIFAIQDEIAQTIAQALKGTLSPHERRAIKHVATADAEAYEHYLKGRKFYFQFRRRGVNFAIQMFSRAIEIDPSYALAYAGIADCCSYLYFNVERSEENRKRADEASLKALALDPDLAEAHAARAQALSLKGEHEAAEREFEITLKLNPRLFEAHYYYARDSFMQGKFEKALELYEKAQEVRPEDYQSPLLVAQIYSDLGREEEAKASRERGVRLAEARLDLNPDDVRALYMGANGLVALGENEKGLAWAKRAFETEPDEPMLLYNLACIYSLAGEVEEALNCLEKALDNGFAHRPWIEQDSNLDALRDHERYLALLKRIAV